MIIKVSDVMQYEVESAIVSGGQIVGTRADGTQVTILGDLANLEVIGGEIVAEPTQLDQIEAQAVYTAMMTDTLLEE